MSTTRILIAQGGLTYRFLRLETSPDGSLICFLDRDARPKTGGFRADSSGLLERYDSNSDKPLPYGRFSIHTTGQVHRYVDGRRADTIHIEPLYQLTRLTWIGFFSIPRPERLDLLDPKRDTSDAEATLEIPDDVSERLTFLLEIGPKPQNPSTYGVALNYEIYSVVIRLDAPATWANELADHFIHGIPTSGSFSSLQIDKANAELKFHQSVNGPGLSIFREDKGGAYIAMASAPKARVPSLTILFDRRELYIEIIPFDVTTQPTHKLKFWICDKGGRNKTQDLREHIVSVQLDARLI